MLLKGDGYLRHSIDGRDFSAPFDRYILNSIRSFNIPNRKGGAFILPNGYFK